MPTILSTDIIKTLLSKRIIAPIQKETGVSYSTIKKLNDGSYRVNLKSIITISEYLIKEHKEESELLKNELK